MKYFFVLGNNPTLSLAELTAVLDLKNSPKGKIEFFDNILVIDLAGEIDPETLIRHLGGTVKIGKVTGELPGKCGIKNLIDSATLLLKKDRYDAKVNFGFSLYGNLKFNIKALGMETKKYFREQGAICRWVVSQERALSSVVVTENKLIETGADLALIGFNASILIGKTLAVQPFKELSRRDYGRPARDDRSGMLPPKLAMIMINLTGCRPSDMMHENTALLDPFCGSGTILTEAALMGFKNLIGTDASPKAIKDTKENIEWIIGNLPVRQAGCDLEIGNLILNITDVRNLSKSIAKDSVGCIVTEPFLGPQRGRIDMKHVLAELERLYIESLKEFSKVLRAGGRVVMVWPVFGNSELGIGHKDMERAGFKIVDPVPASLSQNKNIGLTHRQTIIYGRQGQRVWREIVVLEKQKKSN
jgi:tRNA G10  N-methylase Trm11